MASVLEDIDRALDRSVRNRELFCSYFSNIELACHVRSETRIVCKFRRSSEASIADESLVASPCTAKDPCDSD